MGQGKSSLESVARVKHIAHAINEALVDQNRACEGVKVGIVLLAHWVVCLSHYYVKRAIKYSKTHLNIGALLHEAEKGGEADAIARFLNG